MNKEKIGSLLNISLEDHNKLNSEGIMLIIPPPWDVRTPPVGLGYLTEYLVNNGINVRISDFNIKLFDKLKDKYGYLWNFNNQRYWYNKDKFKKVLSLIKNEVENCVNEIINSKIRIICFSVSTPQENISAEMIRRIKKIAPKLKIIVGGPSINYSPGREFFIKGGSSLADVYVVGEGEETLFELVKKINGGKNTSNIKGTLLYQKGKYSRLLKREPIDYNKLDIFPKYNQFNLSKYTHGNMLTVQWSRGCVGNCSFCQDKAIWGKYRSRSPKSIVNEIKYHIKKNNIKYLLVCDSTINGNLVNLERVCNLIIKSKLKIKWSGLAIPKRMSYNLLKKMKMAGCYRLDYGVESGSDKVLKLMRKTNTVKDSEETLKRTHDIGIKTALFMMVGFPGETEEDFQETLNFIKRNKNNIDLVRSINGLYIQDGTDIKKNPEDYGIIEKEGDETGYNWYTKSGNTAEKRKEKIKKVIDLLDKLGIRHDLDTTFEEGIINKSSTNNKINVELVITPPWGVDYPPLSLAYLSAYLRAKGIKTEVLDSNINIFYSCDVSLKKFWKMDNFLEWNSEDKFRVLKEKIENEINEEVNRVSKNYPDLVCFSVNLANMLTTKEFIKKLKKVSDSKIVCGGPAIKDKWVREHFYNLCDYFIIGEGEEALFSLYKSLDRNENKVIPGVIKLQKGVESEFIERKRVDINSIPFPDYDVFPLEKYKMENIPFLLSRGCIRRCLFCDDTKIFKDFLSRDPKKVVKEIFHHQNKYGTKSFKSHDLLINGNLEKLEEFCDLLIKSKIKINWSGQAIIREMPLNLFKKMKESGLNSIVFGLESASDKLIRSMNKNHTEKTAEDVIKKARLAGIKVYINLMVGFPGEKESDLIKTMEFMKRNKDNISGVSSLNKCVIFKDTALYKRREDFNIKVQEDNGHWIQWTDKEGNDCEGRKNKVFRMLKFLNNINMPVEETNEFGVKIKKNIKDKIKFKIINIKKDIIYKKYVQQVISLSDLLHYNFIKKISNRKDKIKVFKKKAIPYPKYVTIDITNSCNLNCIGCWTHSPLLKDKEASEEWKSQIIAFGTLKKLIDDLKGLGTERIRLTGGGEPFMHPRIMDVIRIIKEKRMACDITTNFTLLNKDKIKKLFDLNVDEIVASIWAGDAETYVKTHPNQTKETFEKIKENLIFIAQYKEKFRKGPRVIMANVISNVNYNKVEEIAKFTTHVSLDEIYFTLIDPIKGRTDCLLLSEKQRRVLIRQLKQAKKVIRDYNKRSKIHKINIDDINRFIKKIKSKKADEGKYDIEVLKKPCYIGYIFARIMANGDVVPCCRAVMYPMGNINKTLFKDIWFSDRYDKFRERALHDNKLNPYFKKIGCFMTCDNVVHNREIENMKQ